MAAALPPALETTVTSFPCPKGPNPGREQGWALRGGTGDWAPPPPLGQPPSTHPPPYSRLLAAASVSLTAPCPPITRPRLPGALLSLNTPAWLRCSPELRRLWVPVLLASPTPSHQPGGPPCTSTLHPHWVSSARAGKALSLSPAGFPIPLFLSPAQNNVSFLPERAAPVLLGSPGLSRGMSLPSLSKAS